MHVASIWGFATDPTVGASCASGRVEVSHGCLGSRTSIEPRDLKRKKAMPWFTCNVTQFVFDWEKVLVILIVQRYI